MATDVTRLLRGERQGYVGGHYQQGRPLLDSDANETARARAEDFLSAIRDVAGVRGSRDDGFLPDLAPGQVVSSKLVRFGAVVQAFVLDYALKPGSIHLGGWRLEQDTPGSAVFQREFLQIGPASAPLAQIGTQRHLSILRAWEQPVSTIEDAELLEAAMHGADGALRMRRMRRVETRTVESGDCAEAFEEVLGTLGDGDTATYDAKTCRLVSNARLQLTFGTDPPGECPGCDPVLRGRYLGSEDQTIRIMLASTDTYVWATDDGAPLYRAKLIFDGTGAQVEMLTPPKDRHHEPKANRVVELLPWSALLENGTPSGGKGFAQTLSNEKVAERAGVLGTVDAPYLSASRSFHVRLDTAALQALGLATPKKGAPSSEEAAQKAVKTGTEPGADVIALEWDPAHPNASELNFGSEGDGTEVGYVYLRFWQTQRPGEGASLPLNGGAPLGRTGVVPVFSGKGRRGDFWRATLRVADPDRILPWAILESGGLPPDGPQDVVAPVALVTWRSFFGKQHEVVSVEDCRPNLPAINNRGCCTHVVGGGAGARYATVQAAIDALPASGGRICIREGTYAGAFHVAGRTHVIIEGCGTRTRLVPDGGPEPALALMTGGPGGRIVLRDLAIETGGQIGVELRGEGLRLERLQIRTSGSENRPAANAIRGIDVAETTIRACHLVMGPGESEQAACLLRGAGGVLIEDCEIGHDGEGSGRAWGGIHIAGNSAGVDLRGVSITGAGGSGITLGSVAWRATDGSDLGIQGPGFGQRSEDGTVAPTGRLEPQPVDDRLYYPEPDLAITDLLICDCDIAGCQGSGIGVLAFQVIHDEVARSAPLCMRRRTFPVSGTLRANRLRDNAQGRGNASDETCQGGIVLSEVQRLDVHRNVIEGPGRGDQSGARCGVLAALGADLTLRENRIILRGNASEATVDLSGGIVLGLVRPQPLLELVTSEAGLRVVRVEDNIVASANGPALAMVAGGACAVSGNGFETASDVPGSGPFGITTLAAIHPARVAEAVDLPTGEPSPDRWQQPTGSREFLSGQGQEIDADGALVLCDNQISTRPRNHEGEILPVAVISRGSVSFLDNELSALPGSGGLSFHAFVMGVTAASAGNRVAESLEAGEISLVTSAHLLTLGTDNRLTHCPVIFGCTNHNDDDFIAAEDNLNWFQTQEQRCEAIAGGLHPLLARLCTALYGDGPNNDFTTGLTTGLFRRREP